MIRTHRHRIPAWVALAALCGGLLPGQTCMVRTRNAVVDGTKAFVTGVLLNPDNLADLAFEDVAADLTGQ